jgi:hypothetical protein
MRITRIFPFPSPDLLRRPSLLLLLFAAVFAFWFLDFWKPYNSAKHHHNFNADVANYYSYLPAYFCNGGSFDFMWGTDSMYLPVGPKQTYVPKATYGMSAMYAPFFALGYKIAVNQGSPLDGFSEPFATTIRWGSIFYVLLGLYFLRKLLLRYFSETITALTLFAALFGSLLFNYTYVQSELTHGYLFCLFSLLLYLSGRWHEGPRYGLSVAVGIVMALVSLIRPTEIFIFLFFLLWNVKRLSDLKGKATFLISNFRHLAVMAGVVLLMWLPQLLFWKVHTGQYVYYAYMDERFFWGDPQLLNLLFSYRKGWIVYTPVVLLSFAGFFTLKSDFPVSRWSFLGITALTVYVLSCWWDWSFGGCFGARALCQHIAFLAVPMAAFLDFVFNRLRSNRWRGMASLLAITFVFSAVCLNIGQTYQAKQNVIHPWATTRELYWYVFRKYQFDDRYQEEYWSRLKFIDHEKWMRGEGRDDK